MLFIRIKTRIQKRPCTYFANRYSRSTPLNLSNAALAAGSVVENESFEALHCLRTVANAVTARIKLILFSLVFVLLYLD